MAKNKSTDNVPENDRPSSEIFGNLDDFYFDPNDYDEFEELVFDGGADYGE